MQENETTRSSEEVASRKVRINRDRWLRGEGGSMSKLHRPEDGKQCCLGFYLQDCGVSQEEMKNMGSPLSLTIAKEVKMPEEAGWLLETSSMSAVELTNSPTCRRLMDRNDSTLYADYEREEFLIREFKKNGVEVEFYNETDNTG